MLTFTHANSFLTNWAFFIRKKYVKNRNETIFEK